MTEVMLEVRLVAAPQLPELIYETQDGQRVEIMHANGAFIPKGAKIVGGAWVASWGCLHNGFKGFCAPCLLPIDIG